MPDSAFHVQPVRAALDGYRVLLTRAAHGLREAKRSTEPEQWRFEWQHCYTRDEWLDQLPTHGALTRVPPQTLAEVLRAVGAAIDGMGGSVTMAYSTGWSPRREPAESLAIVDRIVPLPAVPVLADRPRAEPITRRT
jgi:hypothetical protein